MICQGRDYADIEDLIGKIYEYNRNASRVGDVTIACGMARFEDDVCVASVLERADHRMYENKKTMKASG